MKQKKETKLEDFVSKNTQVKTASLLGVGQSAVSQMLAAKREIYVVQNKGSFSAYEKKWLGRKA